MRNVLARKTETTNLQVAELTPEEWADKKLSLKKAASEWPSVKATNTLSSSCCEDCCF